MTWLNGRKRVHFAQAIEELSRQKYYNHKKNSRVPQNFPRLIFPISIYCDYVNKKKR